MSTYTARKSLWDPSSPIDTTPEQTDVPPQRTTKDILRTVHEINDTADTTLLQLKAQGEQLSKAQDGIARIDDRMNGADRAISEIGSWWSMFVGKFRSGPNMTENRERRDEWEASHREEMAAYRESEVYVSAMRTAPPLPAAGVEYTDDEDGDLDQAYIAILQMKQKAILMGEALHDHNKRLDNLSTETDLATGRIVSARRNINTIIKKS